MNTRDAGSRLTTNQAEDIAEAVVARQQIFIGEELQTSIMVVLFNAGDRYASVVCTNGEWSGQLKDASSTAIGIPTCPGGHVLFSEPGLKLGWVED